MMAKSDLTLKLERQIHAKTQENQSMYGCFEVTIGYEYTERAMSELTI